MTNKNGNGNGSNTFNLNWQNIVMTIILFLSVGGAFWALAYNPIQTTQNDTKIEISILRKEISELRNQINTGDKEIHEQINTHGRADIERFLTQKEHNEYKEGVKEKLNRIDEAIRNLKRDNDNEHQLAINNLRAELMAEIKRLDQAQAGDMKRAEFTAWKEERDKTIQAIQDRMRAFSEALDSLYSRVTAIITQTTVPVK